MGNLAVIYDNREPNLITSICTSSEEFLSRLNKNRAVNASLKPLRISLRDGYDSDDERNYQIEVITEEIIVKTTEQIVH